MKKLFFQGHEVSYGGAAPPAATGWTRNPDWLALPDLLVTDQKFVVLFLVGNHESNYVALVASGSAGYTVNWGDGTVENIASGTQANHNYAYANVGGEFSYLGVASKQAIITVTPQGAGTLTGVNLNVRPSQTGVPNNVNVPWLDIAVNGPNITSFLVGSNTPVITTYNLEKATLGTLNLGNCSHMFRQCRLLQKVVLTSASTATATSFAAMFNECYAVTELPAINTTNGTSFFCMFQSCTSLKQLPEMNTSKGVEFAYMCQACYALTSVPLLDFSAAMYLTYMFYSCLSLTEVPALQMPKVNTASYMFYDCRNLRKVGVLYAPLLTVASSMFNGCSNLVCVQVFGIEKLSSADYFFGSCASLEIIPAFDFAGCVGATGMFGSCMNIAKVDAYNIRTNIVLNPCKMSASALETLFANLGRSVGNSITATNNPGMLSPAAINLNGTTATGSTTVAMASTTGIVAGMQVLGTGTPTSTPIAVALTDAGDLVTLANHGLPDGDEVSFAAITSTTGVLTNTIYFVKLIDANTFQLAADAGGAVLPLTTNGSGTLRYKAVVVTVNTNVSVVISRPATSAGTNSLNFRALKTSIALMKGWSVN